VLKDLEIDNRNDEHSLDRQEDANSSVGTVSIESISHNKEYRFSGLKEDFDTASLSAAGLERYQEYVSANIYFAPENNFPNFQENKLHVRFRVYHHQLNDEVVVAKGLDGRFEIKQYDEQTHAVEKKVLDLPFSNRVTINNQTYRAVAMVTYRRSRYRSPIGEVVTLDDDLQFYGFFFEEAPRAARICRSDAFIIEVKANNKPSAEIGLLTSGLDEYQSKFMDTAHRYSSRKFKFINSMNFLSKYKDFEAEAKINYFKPDADIFDLALEIETHLLNTDLGFFPSDLEYRRGGEIFENIYVVDLNDPSWRINYIHVNDNLFISKLKASLGTSTDTMVVREEKLRSITADNVDELIKLEKAHYGRELIVFDTSNRSKVNIVLERSRSGSVYVISIDNSISSGNRELSQIEIEFLSSRACLKAEMPSAAGMASISQEIEMIARGVKAYLYSKKIQFDDRQIVKFDWIQE